MAAAPAPWFVLRGAAAPAHAAAFLPDHVLATGYGDGALQAWALGAKRVCAAAAATPHAKGVLTVCPCEAGGAQLLSHGRMGTVALWALDSGALRPAAPPLSVGGLSFARLALAPRAAGGAAVAALPAAATQDVAVVEVGQGAVLHTLALPTAGAPAGMVMSTAFVDEQRLLAGYEDGSAPIKTPQRKKKERKKERK